MKPRTTKTNYNDILLLLIPTFILIIAWIGFTIYGNRVQSTITKVQGEQLKPISPIFDMGTINELKARATVTPVFLFQAPPPTEDPFASNAAEILPLPETTVPTGQPEENFSATDSAQTFQNGGTP